MRLSESEWQIMNALWAGHPATARELAERLPTEVSWAYTTIKTMLSRLHAKGAVSENKRGNTSVYEPLLSQDSARRSALGRLLDSAFAGGVDSLVHSLMETTSLSDAKRRQLIAMLEVEERAGKDDR